MKRMYQEYLNHLAKIQDDDKRGHQEVFDIVSRAERPTIETVPAILALSEGRISRGPLTFAEFEQIVSILLKQEDS
jgi:hypothetical protein